MDQPSEPHILFLPFPAQGHIKSMLLLAQLLSQSGYRATFINSHHNQALLERSNELAAFHRRFHNFSFVSIPDGLPHDIPRNSSGHLDVITSTTTVMMPEFRKLLNKDNGRIGVPTCIIADGVMSFAVDIGEELGIPVFSFMSFGATSTWLYLHLSHLVEEGEVPFPDLDMKKPIKSVPGLESILARQDLPSACRCKDANDPYLQAIINQMACMRRSSRLIINTFEGLEAPIISKLGSLFPRLYTTGPLHALFETFNIQESFDGSLRRKDRSCLDWLESKSPRSVIYVSFGSLVGVTTNQWWEIWYGLVNSGRNFLWVIRSDLILGDKSTSSVPEELEVATRERGFIVDWVPQVEVLSHPAVGGFLTHSGWNSTLESLLAGVPMICLPLLADQFMNRRCVAELWKVGLDMKDSWDRTTVEKLVVDLMEDKDVFSSVGEIRRMAQGSVEKGGSSYGCFIQLIEDIRNLSTAQS